VKPDVVERSITKLASELELSIQLKSMHWLLRVPLRAADRLLGADRLAANAGLVPAARDSGKRVGNNKGMRGGNKVLKRVFYQSAFASLRSAPEYRVFYERKRAEGKRHTQALIALARRRVNVLWAMLRDGN